MPTIYQLSRLFFGHGRFRQMKFSAQDEDEVADILYDTVACPAWLSLSECDLSGDLSDTGSKKNIQA